MAASKHIKIKLREVNRHLVCRLCRGYYVDATTIAECLHSFCRSCIIKYLEKNSFCPICEVQIHKTKPYLNLRLDKALQDVVYKVVPGLYHDEMKRRRNFYAKRQEQIPFTTPEQCGLEERIIFSPEDSISLSLEYLESDDYDSETVSSKSSESGDTPDVLSFPQQLGLLKLKTEGKTSRRESQDVQETSVFPKRYLQCPAVVNVGHLKKFIRMKHDLTDKMQVSIIHKRVPLPDHYTLMDVAYIFTWKRSAPLRFFYQIYQTKKQKMKVPPSLEETNNSKLQTVTEELKSLKNVINEKLCNSDAVKSSENNKLINCNGDKSESLFSEPKQKVQNHILKSVDNNKPANETKSETGVKSEPSVNGSVIEAKRFDTESNTVVTSQNSKSEKSKVVRANATDNKDKVECQKRKSVKTENSGSSAIEVKENESKAQERLLLNPISGQLESISSVEQSKSVKNGGATADTSKDTEEIKKKESTNKVKNKTESQNSKDSKKSSVNSLKSFRKEKLSTEKDGKVEIKNSRENSLTITAVSKSEKPSEKDEAKFSVEIKAGNKESEYDFDGSSPPSKIIPLQEFSKYSKYSKYMAEHRDKWLSKEKKNNWMSLQDFREKVLKENDSAEENSLKKNKKKVVPSLYKLNSEGSKTPPKKIPDDNHVGEKQKGNKTPPTIININTEDSDTNGAVKVEVVSSKSNSPPIKIGNQEGERGVIKSVTEKKSVVVDVCDAKPTSEPPQALECKAEDKSKSSGLTIELSKKPNQERSECENSKTNGSNSAGTKNEPLAMDLTKMESPKSEKSSSEEMVDPASKTSTQKQDEKMLEAFLSAAQKKNIEPLLKIPQYSQMLKNSVCQGAVSPGKNISPSEITQALQFLEDLRSDIKVFEAKNQLNPNSVLEKFSGNLEPYQQLYQQKIDLIRRLKRHQQIVPTDSDASHRKRLKLSPTSEPKTKLSPTLEQKSKTSPVSDEAAQYKSSVDRTLSHIQLMELQSRMLAAQNYKNLLQYYNRSLTFCSGPVSPSKSNQPKTKPSSHSPNKSPQSLSSSSGNPQLPPVNSDSFYHSQNYNHIVNTGLNSEMTYHQMFQSYLNQQEQLNQIKNCPVPKKPVKYSGHSPKSNLETKYGGQTNVKKQDLNTSPSSPSKKS